MRLTKVMGSLFAAGAILVAMSTSSPSKADTPVAPKPECKNGVLTITPQGGWDLNGGGPWKWDQGDGAPKFKDCDKDNHCKAGTWKAKSCSGTLKAYVCTASTCAPPLSVPVSESK